MKAELVKRFVNVQLIDDGQRWVVGAGDKRAGQPASRDFTRIASILGASAGAIYIACWLTPQCTGKRRKK